MLNVRSRDKRALAELRCLRSSYVHAAATTATEMIARFFVRRPVLEARTFLSRSWSAPHDDEQ